MLQILLHAAHIRQNSIRTLPVFRRQIRLRQKLGISFDDSKRCLDIVCQCRKLLFFCCCASHCLVSESFNASFMPESEDITSSISLICDGPVSNSRSFCPIFSVTSRSCLSSRFNFLQNDRTTMWRAGKTAPRQAPVSVSPEMEQCRLIYRTHTSYANRILQYRYRRCSA